MEERIPTLYIAEKYIVLVAAVRLLKDGNSNIKEVQKILKLPVFKEEPFYYTGLYVNLIEAVIRKETLKFIDSFLHDVESASMYYDDEIESDFRQLREYSEKTYYLIPKIEELLMHEIYLRMEDTYRNHKEKVINYMRKNQILKGITVYKDKGTVINKPMLFLDVVTAMSAQDVGKMEKLAFHI